MQDKLKKIFDRNKHIVVLATDHRYFGVVDGLEKPGKVLPPLLPFTDIFMTSQDVLGHFAKEMLKDKPIIIRASGCTSVTDVPVPGYKQFPAKLAFQQITGKRFDEAYKNYQQRVEKGEELTQEEWKEFGAMESVVHMPDTLANERLMLHAEDVRKMGGSGAAVSVYLGTKYQTETLDNLATMSRQARENNIFVIGVVAVGKALGYLEQDANFLKRASAILAAHGADVVKTYNCGKGFENVVESAGVPVIVAGGRLPKGKDAARDSLELAYDSIEKGAAGIDFGRRVWRHEHPVAMIKALREVVHNGRDVDTAYKMFKEWTE